jgi:hypothetical protein
VLYLQGIRADQPATALNSQGWERIINNMMRTAQCILLTVWIGGLCPLLCAFQIGPSAASTAPMCCEPTQSDGNSDRDSDHTPKIPSGPCFCAGHSLVTVKPTIDETFSPFAAAVFQRACSNVAEMVGQASPDVLISSHDPPPGLLTMPLLI